MAVCRGHSGEGLFRLHRIEGGQVVRPSLIQEEGRESHEPLLLHRGVWQDRHPGALGEGDLPGVLGCWKLVWQAPLGCSKLGIDRKQQANKVLAVVVVVDEWVMLVAVMEGAATATRRGGLKQKDRNKKQELRSTKLEVGSTRSGVPNIQKDRDVASTGAPNSTEVRNVKRSGAPNIGKQMEALSTKVGDVSRSGDASIKEKQGRLTS